MKLLISPGPGFLMTVMTLCSLEVVLKTSHLLDKNVHYFLFPYSACQVFHGFRAEGIFFTVSHIVRMCLKKGPTFPTDFLFVTEAPPPPCPCVHPSRKTCGDCLPCAWSRSRCRRHPDGQDVVPVFKVISAAMEACAKGQEHGAWVVTFEPGLEE